jgi:hypothetical protein
VDVGVGVALAVGATTGATVAMIIGATVAVGWTGVTEGTVTRASPMLTTTIKLSSPNTSC